MNKDERHHFILQQLDTREKVMVTDLARLQNVTPETIRRDLAELEDNGKLTRIHGGAVPYQAQKEMVYGKKLSLHLDEKKSIAKRAAEMIQDGDTIAVDVGTTTVHIADMIDGIQGLTIVTNSLSAAGRFNAAIEEQRITGGQVIMMPGVTNPYQASVKGTYTIEFLKRFHFNRCFISCGGVMRDAVYDFDMDESLVSEAMINCSREAILLADSSKLNKKSLFKIACLENFSKVICDEEKPIDWVEDQYQWIKVETLRGKVGKHESRLSYTS